MKFKKRKPKKILRYDERVVLAGEQQINDRERSVELPPEYYERKWGIDGNGNR